MYIEKINIENFQSYYDKVTDIDFNKRLNLVLGTIGAGKSKLFNSFYWTFYNEIYKTEEKWVEINGNNFLSVFNKKVLNEAELNDKVSASAELFIVSDEKSFKIKRLIEIEKINSDYAFASQNNWKLKKQELSVSFKNSVTSDKIILEGSEASDYIDKKLLPKKISKYLWFQGETLNELIDIKNGKTFKDALNFISYIGFYENNINLINLLVKKIERSLNKKKKQDTSDNKRFNKLIEEISSIELKIPPLEEAFVNVQTELTEVNRIIEDINKRLDDIDEFLILKKKKENSENRLRSILKEFENLDKEKSNKFAKSWMLYKTDSVINDGFKKLHVFQKLYEKEKNDNPTGLPYDIPSPEFLKEMLEKRECYICGREFDNDEAYIYIGKRLELAENKIKEISKENLEILNFNNKIVGLTSFESSLSNKVKNIKLDIKDYLNANKQLVKERLDILDEISKISDEITVLQTKHGNRLIESFSSEKNKYNFNIDQRDKLKDRISSYENQIYRFKNDLRNLKNDLNQIPTVGDKKYIEENILKYLEYLSDVYYRTKKSEFDKLLTKIEDKSNYLLNQVTKANKVINGKIRIDRDYFDIKLIDLDDVNNERDVNTGHITLMKMCVINAMVIISNEYKNKSYPFISDAPTSALDDGTTKLYFKVLDEEFEQSIVMTKDLFKYENGINTVDKESLKSFNFNNVFLVEKSGEEIDLTETNSYSRIKNII